MSNGSPASKDHWDKLGVLAGFLASVLVPLAIGLAGHWATSAYQQRESVLKDREFARKWVEISLDILRSSDTEEEKNLRAWAVNVINYYAEDDSTKMSQDLRNDFESGKVAVPAPLASVEQQGGGRAAQVTALETAALQHLLAKDIAQAIGTMQLAYETWPEFRTVDETLKLLRRSQPGLAGAEESDWNALYREIARSMDMRGIDPDVAAALRQAAQPN